MTWEKPDPDLDRSEDVSAEGGKAPMKSGDRKALGCLTLILILGAAFGACIASNNSSSGGGGSAGSSGSRGGQGSSDAVVASTCRLHAAFRVDLPDLSGAEIRERVAQIDHRAGLSHDRVLQEAAQTMVDGANSGDEILLGTGVARMDEHCF